MKRKNGLVYMAKFFDLFWNFILIRHLVSYAHHLLLLSRLFLFKFSNDIIRYTQRNLNSYFLILFNARF